MPRPRACVERTANGRPSIQRARLMSPAATSARTAELETSIPCTRTASMHVHREAKLRAESRPAPSRRPSARAQSGSSALVHAAHAAALRPASARTNSRARELRQRRIERQHQHRIDARLSQQAAAARAWASAAAAPASGRKNCSGCGSKVIATARAPVSRASAPPPKESPGGPDARRRSCRLQPPSGRSPQESPPASEIRSAESCGCALVAHSVTGTLSPS